MYVLGNFESAIDNKVYIYIIFTGSYGEDHGYFGPWKTCKLLLYGRERCGSDASRFRVSGKNKFYIHLKLFS